MKKTGRLHIRVTPELADDIKAYADRRGITITQLVETVFRNLLDQEPAEKLKRMGFEGTEKGLLCTKK